MLVTLAQIKQLAAQHFQFEAIDIQSLAGEVDLNYHLTSADKRHYSLKVSPPQAKPEPIRFQFALLQHLATKGLPFAIPEPVGEVYEMADGRLLRCFSWVPGRMLDEVKPITAATRRQWGRTTGQLTAALANFKHPNAPTTHPWNPTQTLDHRDAVQYMNGAQAELATWFWQRFADEYLPLIEALPKAVNYNDAHQHNLLADDHGNIIGLIDFGDAMYTQRINELAIACAYAAMDLPDPLNAFADVVSGYTEVVALTPAELSVLFPLITARLLISAATAARNQHLHPENEYLQISARPAWGLLEKLRSLPPTLVHQKLIFANQQRKPTIFLSPHKDFSVLDIHPVVDFSGKTVVPIDLSVGSHDLGNYADFSTLPRFSRTVRRLLEDQAADYAIGGYGETRPVYTTDDFRADGNSGPRWRTVHLGTDVWGPVGTAVYAPLDGRVVVAEVDPTEGGYGNVVILHHVLDGELYQEFYTLYGHLSAASVAGLTVGDAVTASTKIAAFGAEAENGGWPPHLHFQVTTDLLGYGGEFPGVAFPEDAKTWLDFCPDPAPFFDHKPVKTALYPTPERLLASRKKHLGYSLSLSYAQPLTMLRGAGQYLYDHTGRRFLDTVNNVAHVGHEHLAVVAAIQRQAAVLNTNSRYLHPNIVRLAEELVATLPPELSVVHFVNSGSEANELALRMCEQWSGTRNMLAVEVGYHGNTGRTIDISGYKFDGKGGQGAPPTTRLLPIPDVFRGRHVGDATPGKTYGRYVQTVLEDWRAEGEEIGGFIAESILSCGGQIVLPEGYLVEVYRHVRAVGGLCVADEVQVGLGRVGKHWWGFELQGVVPDIVTIGKPLGNGHPLGAVVCTPAVAAKFANGMEYFNTFGGNPVSCAAGLAVLDTVKREGLREKATAVGDYLLGGLRALQRDHNIIGDVRGVGFFLGLELTFATPSGPAPATAPAKYVKNRMRELGFLMSTDGPDENVLKIKPPMCFSLANAQELLRYLDRVLAEDAVAKASAGA